MNILELITSALETLKIPVIYGWYDQNINSTHITFLEFDNTEDEYSDDEATIEEHYMQVDIWSKDVEDAQRFKEQVKTLLKNKGLNYQGGQDQFEIDTEIWHIATRWLYVEDLD